MYLPADLQTDELPKQKFQPKHWALPERWFTLCDVAVLLSVSVQELNDLERTLTELAIRAESVLISCGVISLIPKSPSKVHVKTEPQE